MRQFIIYWKRRVFDGFLKLDEAEVSFEHFDGSMGAPVRRLSLERGDSVAVILHDRTLGSVVLVNQFKFPTAEKGPGWIVEALAGVIDAGETPETAAVREAREETGYRVERVERIGTFYVSPGGSSERIWLYYAEVFGADRVSPGGGLASEGEDIELVFLPEGELEHVLASDTIQDAKTLVGLHWLRDRLRVEKETRRP